MCSSSTTTMECAKPWRMRRPRVRLPPSAAAGAAPTLSLSSPTTVMARSEERGWEMRGREGGRQI
jgi:hypothetical protein